MISVSLFSLFSGAAVSSLAGRVSVSTEMMERIGGTCLLVGLGLFGAALPSWAVLA